MVEQVINVPIRPLDAVLATVEPELNQANVYLKIDAQGFDLEVLRGAERSLGSIRALQTELELIPVYASAPNFLSVIQFLNSRNYEITAAFPVWRDSTLRIGELDTVFRNMGTARDSSFVAGASC